MKKKLLTTILGSALALAACHSTTDSKVINSGYEKTYGVTSEYFEHNRLIVKADTPYGDVVGDYYPYEEFKVAFELKKDGIFLYTNFVGGKFVTEAIENKDSHLTCFRDIAMNGPMCKPSDLADADWLAGVLADMLSMEERVE